ncbi:MAG: tetratricopeptide repeat protein [Campylobacterales bacterium]|nr:tetratricopeptide repeat protein [Campylobacterales bacterium]
MPSLLFAAEPSAFGAGKLDSPNPYGLTETEKQILSTKKAIDTIEEKTFSQLSRVESIQERMDGLQSIVEGLNEKSQVQTLELKQLQSARDMSESEMSQRFIKLEERIAVSEAQVVQIKTVLKELTQLIDAINTNYVTKDELNRLINDVNQFKSTVGKSLKVGTASTVEGTSASSLEISNKAFAHYKKKEYDKAIALYTHLIQKNYKPARAHYMIGEIYYYKSEYAKALGYFKESAKLFDKADYMPTLMMHSAVCMEKTGDVENAKRFLEAIIANYPSDKLASDAQVRLNKLP